MRHGYIVCYDISDDKRLRLTFKLMKSFGVRLQFSVFQCELSQMEKLKMKNGLQEIIDSMEDQVLIINIGPAPGRSDDCIESIGRKYTAPTRSARIF